MSPYSKMKLILILTVSATTGVRRLDWGFMWMFRIREVQTFSVLQLFQLPRSSSKAAVGHWIQTISVFISEGSLTASLRGNQEGCHYNRQRSSSHCKAEEQLEAKYYYPASIVKSSMIFYSCVSHPTAIESFWQFGFHLLFLTFDLSLSEIDAEIV